MRTLDEQLASEWVARLRGALLWVRVPRLIFTWGEAELGGSKAALLEARGVVKCQHECERREIADAEDLRAPPRLRIRRARELLHLLVVRRDLHVQQADDLEHGVQGGDELRGQHFLCAVSERNGAAVLNAKPERLERSSYVVHELRPCTHELISGPKTGEIGVRLVAAMMYGGQQRHVDASEPRQ